ncbi:hypothetical protein CpB0231 [Chlamydia pneumoniae TW-183]|uniref:IncA family protein n=3 Tax=Chlamydia pneumoniae TaxID=83558 RepID=Q9Z8V9_CHLPN|nr:IncA family protein [Chlamydia pneumoniae]AAD18378.1 hypothetical protein CPn_0225 [Chlamydia pneumoniae CWL029]AAF38361.1 hypothetical protein CP_0539 [Chlamydia pneumoniae AR39]AAP98164.1 hypothetical protein CpB0231 [Chlamydia pneumoniae TW-183]BAA98435.1 hypothetical protein [Chlamydia pneumoniae J138]
MTKNAINSQTTTPQPNLTDAEPIASRAQCKSIAVIISLFALGMLLLCLGIILISIPIPGLAAQVALGLGIVSLILGIALANIGFLCLLLRCKQVPQKPDTLPSESSKQPSEGSTPTALPWQAGEFLEKVQVSATPILLPKNKDEELSAKVMKEGAEAASSIKQAVLESTEKLIDARKQEESRREARKKIVAEEAEASRKRIQQQMAADQEALRKRKEEVAKRK